jgi:hypothetical protein
VEEKAWKNLTWKERQLKNELFIIGEYQKFLAATEKNYYEIPGMTMSRFAVRQKLEKAQEYVDKLNAGTYDDLSAEITAAWQERGEYIPA